MATTAIGMRKLVLSVVCLLVGLGAAGADPLESTDPAAVLRDPSPRDSHDFSHTLANGGTADVGHELSTAPAAAPTGCNAASPCALPSSPQTHVQEPPPARPG